MKFHALATLLIATALVGCDQHQTSLTGMACLGTDNDTLVEAMPDKCKAGDMIVTKHPAYFCDFTYAVPYNDFNSAFCVFNGKLREERIKAPGK